MSTNDNYVPSEYNTGIVRCDDFEERFAFSIDGSNFVLDGTTAKIQIRYATNSMLSGNLSGSILGTYTNNNGITLSGNVLLWTISGDETATFTPNVYNYDVKIERGGKVRTYISGTFTVIADITI